ncbi:class III lanthipeptide [Streptomyces sp. NPDC051243]
MHTMDQILDLQGLETAGDEAELPTSSASTGC